LQLLLNHGVEIPTGFCQFTFDTDDLIKWLEALDQITRRNTRKSKEGDQKKQQRVLSTPQKFKCEYIMQEFIKEANGKTFVVLL
jgi:hypothetical protein